MAFGSKAPRIQRGCHVGSSCDFNLIIFIGRVFSHVLHKSLLDDENVVVKMRVSVIIVRIVEVTIP